MDSNEGCGVNLSGVFTTTGQTMIEYRVVNELGIKSQTFQVPVDQTNTAYVLHPIDFSQTQFEDILLDLINPEAQDDEVDDFFDGETDQLQGYYRSRCFPLWQRKAVSEHRQSITCRPVKQSRV
ncbi:MAG: hypothetical protein R3F37_02140 [Candidatus Competibacteraceae bacterium]